MAQDWKTHLPTLGVLLASLATAFAGRALSMKLGGFGLGGLFLGPLLVFGGAGLGALAAALAAGRRVTKPALITGLLASSILLAGLALIATVPGSQSDEAKDVWQDSANMATAAAGVVGFASMQFGTKPREKANAKAKVPERAAPVTTKDPAIVMKRAREILRSPTLDTEVLVTDVNAALRELEEISRTEHPLASDARRVHAQLRSEMGKLLVERAWKALQNAEELKKKRDARADNAARRSTEFARMALAIADSERDLESVLKANQCIAAAGLIEKGAAGTEFLDNELASVVRELEEIKAARADRGYVRSREDRLLTSAGALIALAERTGRKDIVEKATGVIAELRGTTSRTGSGSGEEAGRDTSGSLPQIVLGLFEKAKIVKELEGGGFGRTFLVLDENLQRKVVVKTLRDEWVDHSSVREGLRFESVIEAKVRHGIPQVIDLKRSAGRVFKIMEYVPGGSLRDKLNDWKQHGYNPDPVKSVQLVREVVDVLVEAQRHFPGGVVHRDLKPENVLLDEQGHAKLTDFGLAHVPQLVGEPTFKAGTPVGTLRYMSPEQARGELDVSPASDVYSLGVMLHELFTGEDPYRVVQGTTKTAVRDLIKRGEVTVREDLIPEPAREIVRQCLAADSRKRPTLETLQTSLKGLESQLRQKEIQKSVWSSGASSSAVYKSLATVDRERVEDKPQDRVEMTT